MLQGGWGGGYPPGAGGRGEPGDPPAGGGQDRHARQPQHQGEHLPQEGGQKTGSWLLQVENRGNSNFLTKKSAVKNLLAMSL